MQRNTLLVYIYGASDATVTKHILERASVPLLQINFLSSPMTETIENGIFGTSDSTSHIPYLEPHLVYSRTAEFGRATIAFRYTLI